MSYHVTVCFRHSNPEMKSKHTDQILTGLLFHYYKCKKGEYFYYAKIDFDFGHVYIVWWLSIVKSGKTSVKS